MLYKEFTYYDVIIIKKLCDIVMLKSFSQYLDTTIAYGVTFSDYLYVALLFRKIYDLILKQGIFLKSHKLVHNTYTYCTFINTSPDCQFNALKLVF